jgi:hypothetical protein
MHPAWSGWSFDRLAVCYISGCCQSLPRCLLCVCVCVCVCVCACLPTELGCSAPVCTGLRRAVLGHHQHSWLRHQPCNGLRHTPKCGLRDRRCIHKGLHKPGEAAFVLGWVWMGVLCLQSHALHLSIYLHVHVLQLTYLHVHVGQTVPFSLLTLFCSSSSSCTTDRVHLHDGSRPQ